MREVSFYDDPMYNSWPGKIPLYAQFRVRYDQDLGMEIYYRDEYSIKYVNFKSISSLLELTTTGSILRKILNNATSDFISFEIPVFYHRRREVESVLVDMGHIKLNKLWYGIPKEDAIAMLKKCFPQAIARMKLYLLIAEFICKNLV